MYPVNADKEKIIQIVSQWLSRSGLGIEQVLARMQTNGYDIARSTFENRFTTRVQQKPNIPPDCFLALITAFTERLTDDERCTASEAIEMANLARLPIEQFQDIQKLFPHDEFIAAFEQYISPLFGKTYLIQSTTDPQEQPQTKGQQATDPPTQQGGESSLQYSDAALQTPPFEWGDSPDVASFFGRAKQLETLNTWIEKDRCRLIAVLGIGGMGKTTLAKKAAEHVQEDFDYLYWTSLRDAPTVLEVLDDCIRFLSKQDGVELSSLPERRTSKLLQLLRQKRCLLVFDGAEAIMQEGIDVGGYIDGYEDYAELFQTIGETNHNSCLLITSREKPEEFAIMEAASSPVRSLPLLGLSVEPAREVLHDKGLYGDDETWKSFVIGYSGNPLALKLASEPISEVYGGEISAFLKGGIPIVTGVRDLLDAHFSRLTLLERSILNWLAIEREALAPDALLENLTGNVTETELLEALRWLRRRSLIEQNASGLTLQNVVMEYMTDRFIGLVVDEIEANFPMLLSSFTLMKAEAKEYIRKSQITLFIEPIVDNLVRRMGENETEQVLFTMLEQLRQTQSTVQSNGQVDFVERSYLAGNILNLLIHMGVSLEGAELSHLQIQNADLRGILLRGADLSYSDCSHSIFTDTFGSITTTAFSPDGNLLVVGDAGGDVRLWDVASRRQLNAFSGHTDLVWSVAFSPDGRTVASCGEDHSIRLWDVNSSECLGILNGHEGWVKGVAFSNDASTLASCSNDGTLRLWSVESHRCINTIEAHIGWVWSVAFSPDDSLLATSGQDGLVKIWDSKSLALLHTFSGHQGAVRTARFSPDGEWVASGSFDHTVRLWEIATGDAHVLNGHQNQVWTISYSPDGDVLASGGDDQTLRLWRMDTRKPLSVLQGNPSRVWTTAFSPDGATLVSGSDDHTLRFWDVTTGLATHIVEGFSNQIWSVDFAAQTHLAASAGDDKRIYLWPIFTEEQSSKQESNGQQRDDIEQRPVVLKGHTDRIRSLAFSVDGQMLVSGGDDHLVRLWNNDTQEEIAQLLGHTNRVWSVAISPDKRMIASSSEDQSIRLWRNPSGRCFRIIPVNQRIWSVAFSPNNRLLASASDDSLIHLWDVHKGDIVRTLSGHIGRVWSVSFCTSGPANGNTPEVVNVVDSEAATSVECIKLVSSGDDGYVRIWDVESGELLHTLEGHTDVVSSIACSPNGIIASGSDDLTVRVWDVATGECLQTFKAHEGSVRSVVFGPGDTLLSGGSDERLRQWVWKSGEMLLDQRTDRPYERMNISHLAGLSSAQMDTLRLLGAVEVPEL